MQRVDTIVVGGGQAGLAMSRCLLDRGVENVVLERGRVAQRWRTERWDSLRLLTPNWQSRLPGYRYSGPAPDSFMTVPEVVDYLEGYARSFSAPLEEETTVQAVELRDGGYRVTTDRGTWHAHRVVIASGYCDVPHVPRLGSDLAPDVVQVVPSRYRNPGELPSGGVLVVGASATGVQLADEIHRSGRPVTLAVGNHIRLPRRYRGQDILWWLDAMGVFDERCEEAFDVDLARKRPSLQLVGRPDHATVDLAGLARSGVRLAGRLAEVSCATVRLADDLLEHTGAAEQRLDRILSRVDQYALASGLASTMGPADRPEPFRPSGAGPEAIDLRAEGIRTVLWATGFRRTYPWLKVPVLDSRGEVRHAGGVTPFPGLYVLGLNFMRRRKSSFLDGVGADAHELAEHIVAQRNRRAVA